MNYTKGLKKKGFKISYDRVAVTRDGYDLIVDISKKNSYLKCSFSMSHQIGYYFSLEPFDYDSSDKDYFDGDEEWDFDYYALLCEYYGVEELLEM
jgi:hypothetical protein